MNTAARFWAILGPLQRFAMTRLLFFMVVGMLLEMLSVGLVVPALGLIARDDFDTRFPQISAFFSTLGDQSRENLVSLGMLVLLTAYIIKTAFLVFLAWQQSRFVFGLQRDISERLFRGYLSREYIFHLQKNSGQLIGNIISESHQMTGGLISAMVVTTEALNILGILLLLLWIEPLGSVAIALIIGFAAGGFYQFTRGRLLQWGKARQYHEGMRIQHLQQGLGGIKDVKLLGQEENFSKKYAAHNLTSAKMQENQNFLQQLPRLWLELVAVIGIVALVFVSLAQGRSPASLITTLGLFAAAAFRLLPSANRVLGSLQNVRYTFPVIESLSAELSSFETSFVKLDGQLMLEKAIVLDNISYTYPGAGTPTLHIVNLAVERGAAVGFIGSSGAGKSTLVDLILGLLTPTRGNVLVDGVDIQCALRSWQSQIGYVPQSIFLTDDTLRRNVAFGLPDCEIDDVYLWNAICAAQLEEFVTGLPDGIDSVVGERGVRISGGQRQRIGIARALYNDPDVLVLDEATSSLDTITEAGVMEAVRRLQGKKTVIIVAHRLTTIANCDKVYRLDKGRLVEARLESIRGGN